MAESVKVPGAPGVLLRKAASAGKRAGLKVSAPSSAPRRMLLAEIVGAMTIITIAEVMEQRPPMARSYMAAFVVYLGLSFLADTGSDGARFAVAFGGLTLLGIAITRADVFVGATRAIEAPIAGEEQSA